MLDAAVPLVNEPLINAVGAGLGLGGLALTWLWLRVFYRSSGH